MKYIVFIVQIIVVGSFFSISFILILAEENEIEITVFLFHALIDKILAIILFYIALKLKRKWRETNSWLNKLTS